MPTLLAPPPGPLFTSDDWPPSPAGTAPRAGVPRASASACAAWSVAESTPRARLLEVLRGGATR